MLASLFAKIGHNVKLKTLKEESPNKIINLPIRTLIHKLRKFAQTNNDYDLARIYSYIQRDKFISPVNEEKNDLQLSSFNI